MNKGWLLVLLVSLGLNLGLGYRIWNAESPGGSPGGPGPREAGEGRFTPRSPDRWREMAGRRLQHLTRRLNLDPVQQDALRAIQEEHGRRIQESLAALEEFRVELRGRMLAEEADPAEVRRAIHAMGRRQAVLDSLVTETVLQELDVLRPDQRLEYLEMMPFERGPGRSGRFHRNGPRGEGQDGTGGGGGE
ncbi:MAG: Spy/CpxP family protein refolding chaperone [Candidatus Krumholzibacteriia bacterium]